MRILADREGGRITLQPATEEEGQTLRSLVENLGSSGTKLEYRGRSTDGENRLKQLRFEQPEGQDFVLVLSVEEDRNAIGLIRDTCFLGSSGMFYVESGEVDGVFSVQFNMGKCKICEKDLITMDEVVWEHCHSCKQKCSHVWRDGFVHVGRTVGTGQYCGECGLGNSDVPMTNAHPEGAVVIAVL